MRQMERPSMCFDDDPLALREWGDLRTGDQTFVRFLYAIVVGIDWNVCSGRTEFAKRVLS